jgi:hypothetical protein
MPLQDFRIRVRPWKVAGSVLLVDEVAEIRRKLAMAARVAHKASTLAVLSFVLARVC